MSECLVDVILHPGHINHYLAGDIFVIWDPAGDATVALIGLINTLENKHIFLVT